MPTHENPFKPPQDSDDDSALWGYTLGANEVAKLRHERTGDNRPTIGRDTRIDGGVYEGSYGGEAIVVDKKIERQRQFYDEAIEKARSLFTSADGKVDKSLILDSVYTVVSETMRYDQAAVDAIYSRLGGYDGKKIGLDAYVGMGVGVCRHQALFTAQLLEGLADEGIIRGRVSIDRNAIRTEGDRFDGHAWVRYKSLAGEVFILDVAQQRKGTLDDLIAARNRGEDVWDYARPEDKAARRGQQAARVVVETDENGMIIVPDWNK